MFKLSVAIHVYVEAMVDVNGILTVLPLQMVATFELVIAGAAVGVNTYVAVELHPPGFIVNVYVPAPVTDVLAAVGETIVDPPGPVH